MQASNLLGYTILAQLFKPTIFMFTSENSICLHVAGPYYRPS